MDKELFWKIFFYQTAVLVIAVISVLTFKVSIVSASIILIVIFLASASLSLYFVTAINNISDSITDLTKGKFYKDKDIKFPNEFSRIETSVLDLKTRLSTIVHDLSLAEKSTSTILSSMTEGVIAVDGDENLLLVNEAADKMLSVDRAMLGKNIIQAIRNPDIRAALKDAVSGTGPHQKEISLPTGIELLVEGAKTPGGGGVLVMHDITRIKKLEKIRSEFVANVSHELKTPLTSIKASVETLMEGAIYDKEHNAEFLSKITRNADRLSLLIDDILELSNLESTRSADEVRPVSISDTIERAVDYILPRAKAKKVSIRKNVPDGFMALISDDHLLRVLINLLDNAVKYNKDDGNISVIARAKDGVIQVEITDTGIGIEEKYIPRVFERFFTVDKARSRELGGTGLGLAIVKHIIELNGGKITVSSEPGKGSTFSFTVKQA